jgi:endoglucanase
MNRTQTRHTAVLATAAAAALALAGCTSPTPPAPSATSGAATSESPGPAPTSTADALTPAQIFEGGLFLDPRSDAMNAEQKLVDDGDSDTARVIAEISQTPTAIWLGEWHSTEELPSVLGTYVAEAEEAGTTLVFVVYAIPNRDCGGLSAGGLDEEHYLEWVQAIADELEGTGSVMIVEPDSLAMLESAKCAGEVERRLPLISSAVDILGGAGLVVYLDAGNNNWVPETTMARLLTEAGVERARGFFTNVSNFYRVDEEREYANSLSILLDGAHFVIDVSRNGNGWQGDWCNPWGAALGQEPHAASGDTPLDALLWVKHPGESDGACNGGPVAGDWWEAYALDLVANR